MNFVSFRKIVSRPRCSIVKKTIDGRFFERFPRVCDRRRLLVYFSAPCRDITSSVRKYNCIVSRHKRNLENSHRAQGPIRCREIPRRKLDQHLHPIHRGQRMPKPVELMHRQHAVFDRDLRWPGVGNAIDPDPARSRKTRTPAPAADRIETTLLVLVETRTPPRPAT